MLAISSATPLVASWRFLPPAPRRSARKPIWWADSSPLTYKTLYFLASSCASCNKSVLLPMPGWPAIKLTLPATRPPPNTSSTSLTPLIRRLWSFANEAVTDWVDNVWPPSATCAAVAEICSCNVFHSPQLKQRPLQAALMAPQLPQTKRTLSFFAIVPPV